MKASLQQIVLRASDLVTCDIVMCDVRVHVCVGVNRSRAPDPSARTAQPALLHVHHHIPHHHVDYALNRAHRRRVGGSQNSVTIVTE